ncbi:MAG: hypothetical protein AB9869_33885 [Verrucomicrobiia bacterium]
MNEKGLAISTMALGETVNPVPDERPPLVSPLWMQHILDTCATVEDLMRSDGKVRIMETVDHYLVCDREGNGATVEFLGGKMVCHTAGDLPVRALMLKAVLEQRPDFPREQIAPLLDLMENYSCESKE